MLVTPTSTTAVYNISNVDVSWGGSSTAKYNMTNLIKHVRSIMLKNVRS